MPWLVWSTQSQEVIASGEIANADNLHELEQRFSGREVIALAPAVDCAVRRLPVPKKNRRQALAALPYMLEDELAEDIDAIHLVHFAQHEETVDVAYVSHAKMDLWLSWFSRAGLAVGKVLPEFLALPDVKEPSDDESTHWHMVQVGDHWLVRQAHGIALGFENEMMAKFWLSSQDLEHVEITSFTPWPETFSPLIEAHVDLPELPMSALVNGAINSACNLRAGDYKIRRQRGQQPWRPWLNVAVLAGVALVLYLSGVALRLSEFKHIETVTRAEIVKTYKIAFPNEKRVNNPKVQMKRKLAQLGSGDGASSGLLMFLHDIGPAYRSVSGIVFQSLRYDEKRQELRIQASGSDFQKFEQLKAAIGNGYSAELGALNSKNDQVTGTITVRKES
nr:type II secretion system protein GspL [Echinimonas agarilytica]